MQFDAWWNTLSVFWSGILLAAQANAGDARRDQDTGDLDLQWDARWKHWPKHDTAYIQADYVLQCNVQFNLWTRHKWWQTEDFHPRVTVDQAEGLCHRITLNFGMFGIETGALYYCIWIRLKYLDCGLIC